MNAIQEALATIREWQVRDPETRFLDGHSMSGAEAWRACLRKVRDMLESVCRNHCISELAKAMDDMADTMDDLHDELDDYDKPCIAEPRLAPPCRAITIHATTYSPATWLLASPGLAGPCLSLPRQAAPGLAWPCQTWPCRPSRINV